MEIVVQQIAPEITEEVVSAPETSETQPTEITFDISQAQITQMPSTQVEAQPEKFTTEVIQEQVTDVEGMQVVGTEITFDVSQATVSSTSGNKGARRRGETKS